MVVGEKDALAMRILHDDRTSSSTSESSREGHVSYIVARGYECERADQFRRVLLRAISRSVHPLVKLIGTADTYGVLGAPSSCYPRLFSNTASHMNGTTHLGIIALEKDTVVWVTVMTDDGGDHTCRATVTEQNGQFVTVHDGANSVEIDLLFEEVRLDIVFHATWRYNYRSGYFEKVTWLKKRMAENEEAGQLSKHRVQFCPWRPSDDKGPRRLENCAVSIGWLEEFCNREDVKLCGSTREVVERIVKLETAEVGCRYADLLPRRDVGRSTYFISHRWGALFTDMVRSVLHYHNTYGKKRVTPRQQAFVWLDVFAVNQHVPLEDLDLMGDVVECARQTLLCLDAECQVLNRLWCVYEVWQTLCKGGSLPSVETPAWRPLTLQIIAAGDAGKDDPQVLERRISKLWLQMSTAQAVTGRPADKERILKAISLITDSTDLDFQIMAALCNTGLFACDGNMSWDIPPWEMVSRGATAEREAQFKDRVEAMYRIRDGLSGSLV